MDSTEVPNFFIPHLRDDAAGAEIEWQRYLRELARACNQSRRVFSLRWRHDGDEYLARIGERRQLFARKTGPRGGYLKNAGVSAWGLDTGTVVSGIVDDGNALYVWSYGPPFSGWANPAMVSHAEASEIVHFSTV